MIADARLDAGRFRAPADDAVGVLLKEGIGCKLTGLAAGECGRDSRRRHRRCRLLRYNANVPIRQVAYRWSVSAGCGQLVPPAAFVVKGR
jgi:hypothetical protein